MISKTNNFTDFAMISNKSKKIQEELRKELEDREYVIDTYGEATEEYKAAKWTWGKEERIE